MRKGLRRIKDAFSKRIPVYYRRLVFRGVLLAILLQVSISGCTSLFSRGNYSSSSSIEPVPQPLREFRGVWVASVVNIDWPSEKGLSTSAQQAELVALLDQVVRLNMNAVIFQVRPAADALYDSALEPWSEYLSGTMGVAPEPFYDPLAFAIEEAHKRGLELHAWFNPFRARHVSGSGEAVHSHVSNVLPDAVVQYGEQLWMDPGNEAAQYHTLRVIRDVVQRYDVDGIHIDDYFYPYPTKDKKGRLIDFPDHESWAKANESSVVMSRNDWRRSNINKFVERLYQTVKQEKPWVKVGISPFGIWRPGHPENIRGLDAYSNLYADSKLWLQNGWVDYLSPQLYWSINSSGQSFTSLYSWWSDQNIRNRHVWPGSAIYRVDTHGWREKEIIDQIRFTRDAQTHSGNILFSMRILNQKSHRLAEYLASEVYTEPALIPESSWLYYPGPGKPSLDIVKASRQLLTLHINTYTPERVRKWVVRARYGREWQMAIVPGDQMSYQLPAHFERLPIGEIAVSAVGRLGKESAIARMELDSDRSEIKKTW